MTDEQMLELRAIRETLIELRNEVLTAADFQAAVGLSHAIMNLHFAMTGEERAENEEQG